MDEEPVLKIRKLTIKREDRGEYLRQAENNMHQSIPAELDTLIIGSGHEDPQGTIDYTIELFRNELAEHLHIASDHADDYEETIKKIASDRELFDLKAEIVTTKSNESLNAYSDEFVMRLTHVVVKDGDYDKFAHAIKKEITTAMAEEPGAKMIIAGSEKSNPNSWYIWEVYTNDKEYENHLKSTHFTEYQAEVKDLIEKRDVKVLFRDTLASQGAVVLD